MLSLKNLNKAIKKNQSLSTLDKKLWKIFSEYIRQRDSVDGYCKCISCGKVDHWKNMDAGHYINRRWKGTKFHEENVNAQCRSCNRFSEGAAAGYSIGIEKKYGTGTIQKLYDLSRIKTKFDRLWYLEMIETYKQKCSSYL